MPRTVITPRKSLVTYLREVWRYRNLFGILCLRELRVRYRQTAIGVAWAVLRPLLSMLLLAFVFGRVAGLSGGAAAYPLLVLVGTVGWQFFAGSFSAGTMSLVVDQRIITKVYFPRLIIPLSSLLTNLVDLGIGLILLAALGTYYGMAGSVKLLAVPLVLLPFGVFTAGLTLIFAALNVRYRDFRYVLPFLLQLGLYASPVGYPSSVVPQEYQVLYALNPLVGFIEAFRWSLLPAAGFPAAPYWCSSLTATLAVGLGGLYYFRRADAAFADTI